MGRKNSFVKSMSAGAGVAFLLVAMLPVTRVSAVARSGGGISDARVGARVERSLGRCRGDVGFDDDADLNGDGCVNALDVAAHRGARRVAVPGGASAGATEQIVVQSPAVSVDSDGSVSVLFLIQNNATPLLGYSLDVTVVPGPGAVGTVSARAVGTNFFQARNVIAAGGAVLDPTFSQIFSSGDGGVFVNAITDDNSTVLASDGVNDVLAQVVFRASAGASGEFAIELGPASVLSDGAAFPVPFGFSAGSVFVVTRVPTNSGRGMMVMAMALVAGAVWIARRRRLRSPSTL